MYSQRLAAAGSNLQPWRSTAAETSLLRTTPFLAFLWRRRPGAATRRVRLGLVGRLPPVSPSMEAGIYTWLMQEIPTNMRVPYRRLFSRNCTQAEHMSKHRSEVAGIFRMESQPMQAEIYMLLIQREAYTRRILLSRQRWGSPTPLPVPPVLTARNR